jgi:glucose-1-phosphate adenylyltransferase
MNSMNAVGVILGGGAGTRLQPLTRDRSKPAVPLAGTYRLVDIPISNCINNDIYKIFVLTQFNSVSLHQHINSTYRFDTFETKFVRILAAQQTPSSQGWFTGTADAVRQTLNYFLEQNPKYVIVLSGDQLYRLNFKEIVAQHEAKGSDVTIIAKPVDREEASDLGIMKVDEDLNITAFHEKPGKTKDVTDFSFPLRDEEMYLASMGIYVFNTPVLKELLDNDHEDFGKEIIPSSIDHHQVQSYIYEGYWRDIGTIHSFWEANLSLTDVVPPFTFYDALNPIYSRGRSLPPSKINSCAIKNCLISQGCIISGESMSRCVVGIRAIVGERTVVQSSILMGADHYENEPSDHHTIALGVGNDCYIKNAIIDKDVRIGNGVHITPDGKPDGTPPDGSYTVSDGVIVIPKGSVIPDGTHI